MLLTIAIPSHRHDHLEEAILSIVLDPAFGKKVNLNISDNSLGEKTKKLIDSKFKQFSDIHYHRSLEYGSLDENVNRSVETSNGEYVWVFGDDDLLVDGVLTKIVQFLEEKQPDLVLLNSMSFKGSQIIEASRIDGIRKDLYNKDENDEFFQDLGGYLTYLGSILVRKSLWVKYFDKSNIGTYFAHLVTISKIKLDRSLHFFQSPSIKMRVGSQTWTNKSFQIWNCFYPHSIWNLKGYSDFAKNSVISRRPINSFRRMFASRAYGHLYINIWWKVIFNSQEVKPISKILTFLLCLFPRWVIVFLYRSLIVIARNKKTKKFSPKLALSQL